MLVGRDRVLAWFLAVQLLTAAVFGGVLVHVLRQPVAGQTLVVGPGGGGSVPTATAGPTATPTASAGPLVAGGSGGSAGSAGTPGSVCTGGSAGAGTGAGAGGAGVRDTATLTFGSIVTQNFSISFKDSKVGTQAYLAQVNAAGGANGHRLEMIYNDDQGSASTGYKQAQSLINQKVLAFAAFNAPITEGYSAFKTLVDDNKIPLIGSYGQSIEYKDENMFAFSANYVHFGYQMGMFLVQHGVKKPGFIYIDNSPDTVANDQIERGFKAGISAAGGDGGSAVFDKVSTTQATFDSDLSQFQVQGVDGFASILDNTGYGRLLQAQARANYYPTHVATPLFALDSVKSQARTDVHPVYVATDIDFLETGGPAVQAYVKAVRAQGKTPSYLGEAGWLSATYLAEAVKRVQGVVTREKLLAAVNSLNGFDNGFTSPLRIAPGRHDMNRCIKFGLITNQVLKQVQDWTCDTQVP